MAENLLEVPGEFVDGKAAFNDRGMKKVKTFFNKFRVPQKLSSDFCDTLFCIYKIYPACYLKVVLISFRLFSRPMIYDRSHGWVGVIFRSGFST